jgi:hypothetical protein
MLPMDASVKTNEMDSELERLAARVIATRIGEFAPLVHKWQQDHARVPLARLVEDGLKLALKPYAGKRYAHLVEPKNGEVAA